MPLYRFRCECGYEWKEFVGVKEYPPCPKCGKKPRRVPGRVCVVYKCGGIHGRRKR